MHGVGVYSSFQYFFLFHNVWFLYSRLRLKDLRGRFPFTLLLLIFFFFSFIMGSDATFSSSSKCVVFSVHRWLALCWIHSISPTSSAHQSWTIFTSSHLCVFCSMSLSQYSGFDGGIYACPASLVFFFFFYNLARLRGRIMRIMILAGLIKILRKWNEMISLKLHSEGLHS